VNSPVGKTLKNIVVFGKIEWLRKKRGKPKRTMGWESLERDLERGKPPLPKEEREDK
jgi:hypothetical protein